MVLSGTKTVGILYLSGDGLIFFFNLRLISANLSPCPNPAALDDFVEGRSYPFMWFLILGDGNLIYLLAPKECLNFEGDPPTLSKVVMFV